MVVALAEQSGELERRLMLGHVGADPDPFLAPDGQRKFFGQNIPYPGFGEHSGFVASLVIMTGIAAGLFVAFKCKDWL